MAYERRNGPLGGQRGDYRAALIAHTIASVYAEKGKQPRFADFMPDWAEMTQEATSGDDP
jgi:hypothetical protein